MGGHVLSEVRILGDLELVADDSQSLRLPRGRARDALVLLAVNCGRPVRFLELVRSFDDSNISDEQDARLLADGWLDALQQQLPGLEFDRTSVGVTLTLPRHTVDALRFIDNASKCSSLSDAFLAMTCWRSDPVRTHLHLLAHVWAPVYRARDHLLSQLSGWEDQDLAQLECLSSFLSEALEESHPMRTDIELRLRRITAVSVATTIPMETATPASDCRSTMNETSVMTARTLDEDLSGRTSARLTYDEVTAGVAFMATAARSWWPERIVGINRGGAIVGGLLAKALGIRHIGIIDLIADGAALLAVERPSCDDQLERVLVVDEANRSGRHLECAKHELSAVYPSAEIRAAALVDVAYVDHDDAFRPLDIVPYITTLGTVRFPWDPE
jgi:hypoxanthine phosphoribosyltransferase